MGDDKDLGPGFIWAPYTIEMRAPEVLGGHLIWSTNTFKLKGQKYDIIYFKEFIRRKKMEETYYMKPINSKYYSTFDVSKIDVTQTDEEVIMDVSVQPKENVQHLNIDFEILKEGMFRDKEKGLY